MTIAVVPVLKYSFKYSILRVVLCTFIWVGAVCIPVGIVDRSQQWPEPSDQHLSYRQVDLSPRLWLQPKIQHYQGRQPAYLIFNTWYSKVTDHWLDNQGSNFQYERDFSLPPHWDWSGAHCVSGNWPVSLEVKKPEHETVQLHHLNVS
jgi:hypothetical protein